MDYGLGTIKYLNPLFCSVEMELLGSFLVLESCFAQVKCQVSWAWQFIIYGFIWFHYSGENCKVREFFQGQTQQLSKTVSKKCKEMKRGLEYNSKVMYVPNICKAPSSHSGNRKKGDGEVGECDAGRPMYISCNFRDFCQDCVLMAFVPYRGMFS